jgi:predicted RNase H-like HicB family nuclease
MVIQWSNEDQAYLVHLPEFPAQHFVTHGDTYEEAAKHGQEAIESLIEWYSCSRSG